MLARKNIKDITPYEPGKPIEEVQRELGLKEVIKISNKEKMMKNTYSGLIILEMKLISMKKF